MLALTAIVFGLQAALPGETWAAIVIGALLSQAFAFGRLWLRTASIASVLALVELHLPVPAPVPATVGPEPVALGPTPEPEALSPEP
jgi:hypothetical protein